MAAADGRLLKLISGGGRRTTFVGLLRDLAKTSGPAEPKTPKVKTPKAKAHKAHKGAKKAKKKSA